MTTTTPINPDDDETGSGSIDSPVVLEENANTDSPTVELALVELDHDDDDHHPDADDYAADALTEPARAYLMVDGESPGAETETAGPAARRPIIPDWARTKASRRAAIRSWVESVLASVLFHLVRSPAYAFRVAIRSPRGVARIARPVAHWCGDHGADVERERLAETVNATHNATLQTQALDLARHHRSMVALRAAVVAGVALLLSVATWQRFGTWPLWQQAGTVAAALIVLGWVGTDSHRPILSKAIYTGARPLRPTPELVTAWLATIGIGPLTAAIKADRDAIRYLGPAQRQGAGWHIECDLPMGVTVGEVIDKRDKLASSARRPLSCMWPTPNPDSHEGRLVLYIADNPLSAGGPLRWSLTDKGKTNLFESVPLGIDHRGEPVEAMLMYASGVIGSIPRMGKTWLLRLIGLAGALDHRCEIHAYDLKGTGDLRPLEPVSTVNIVGDDPEDLEAAISNMRALQTEMRRRSKVIRQLPLDHCPDSKVTNELANRRDLGLHPILLLVDECQIWFEHPTYGDELTSIGEDLVRRGPALGIMAWFATQRPDRNSIPTGIKDNAVLRFALKVANHTVSDMVLNDTSIRAHMLSRKDLGVAVMAGEGDESLVVKTAAVDAPGARAIAERGLAARRAAGWEFTQAEPDTDSTTFAEHLAAAWPTGRDKVAHEEMAGHLATARPDIYADISADVVSAKGRTHGLTPVANCRASDGTYSLRGFGRDDVMSTAADRIAARSESGSGNAAEGS